MTDPRPKRPARPTSQPGNKTGPKAGPRPGPNAAGKGRGAPDTHTPTTQRLFFALPVPADVTPALVAAQGKLRGNWRSVPADQMHVTLAYLPAVPHDRVDDLKKLGTRLFTDAAPLDLKLRGTGYFPNEGSPRVWFVKVEAEGLNELAAALRAEIQALGLSTDDLPFKAHVTLARKKGPAPRVPPILFPQHWTAGSAGLHRSILRKTGPIHETVSTFRLRGTPATPAPAPESAAAEAIQETP